MNHFATSLFAHPHRAWPRPSLWLLILFISLLVATQPAQATSFHTITIDGTNDFVADETFTTSSGGYTAYATWDANNLYLGYTGGDVGAGESATKWVVWYIDTDPQCGSNGGNGTNYAAQFNAQRWSLPFRADYFMQVRTDEGLNQLNSWNGASWTAATYSGAVNQNDGANFMELSLPLSDIGDPSHIRILGYFLNEQGGGEWTYASWPDVALAGGDGYKRFGTFYNWYEFNLVNGVAPNAPANFSPAQNCTVNPSSTNWGFVPEPPASTGVGEYVVGPGTPPTGQGSARLTTPLAADGRFVGTLGFAGTRLADIDALSYSTYRTSGNPAWMSSLSFSINYDLTNATGWQGRLTYEPYVQVPAPTLANNTWYTWDTINGGNGRWWASGAPGNATCGIATPCTWSAILAAWPNAGINFGDGQFISKAGSGWAGFDGNVDNFAITVNGVAYTFDLEPTLPVHNITQNTSHPTIQAGINAANPNDVLEIDPGTYVENVVVNKSITLRGSGQGNDPLVDTILNGTTIPGRGIFINAGITNVTIEDLRVVNYGGANGTGIYANGQNNHFTVQNVTANNNGPGSISASGGIYMNGPVNNVLIDNVTAHGNWGRGIVIWNGFKTNITITNNDVRNNICCGIELQDGTASGVTISGNTIVDNSDSGIGLVGLMAGAGANVVANNTITNNGRFGIEIKLPNGTGATSGDGSIVIENNIVSRSFVPADARDLAGIAVYRRGWLAGNVDIPTGVVVRNNTVTGYQQTTTSDGFGIVVEGTNMTVSNNTLNTNDVGVQLQAGHLPYTANTNIDGNQANLADQYFGRGNSPVGCATITGNTFAGNTVDTRNVNGIVNGGNVLNSNTAVAFCTIQDAIDAASTLNSHTIVVSAGTYAENVYIDKEVTLQGPNAGVSGWSGSRVAEAIIDGDTGTAVTIEASNVTLNGFRLIGDYGVSSEPGSNNKTIQNNLIQVDVTAVRVNEGTSLLIRGNQISATATLFFFDSNTTPLAYANHLLVGTAAGLTTAAPSSNFNARHNWWGTHTTQPTGVDNDSWAYRLGAPIASWGVGSLGAASLTAAGGSGIPVIISHGRGLANVPFGAGADPYASNMCSDYYDFFVINPSGNWTVSVPTDAGAACADTRTNGALYQFALAGTAPDTACVGGACWNVPAGVGLSGNNLQVTVDSAAILQGTPFVAGDATPDSNDPTAVTLANIGTNTAVLPIGLFFVLLLLATALIWRRPKATA